MVSSRYLRLSRYFPGVFQDVTAFDSQNRHSQNEARSDAELRAEAGAASTLRGEVERVTYSNAENGYSVLRIRDTATNVTVTATGVFVDIKAGEL
ncbi:MAG: hypothetical protein EBU49_05725, partial [Proteobacteria bacterium]|nr:hypothetical protein [Pseudomonadota bacterium]